MAPKCRFAYIFLHFAAKISFFIFKIIAFEYNLKYNLFEKYFLCGLYKKYKTAFLMNCPADMRLLRRIFNFIKSV